jgi:hypothetical protein
MTVNRNLTRPLLVLAVALGMLCGSSAAFAATGSHPAAAKGPAPRQRVLRQGMYVAGFDPAIARAHGYKIVTYADGDQQSVPVNPGSRLPRSPILHHGYPLHPDANSDYDKVYGNCGISWISVLQTAPSQVQIATGFTVTPAPAIGVSWTISVNTSLGSGTSELVVPPTAFTPRTSWGQAWTGIPQHIYSFDYIKSGAAFLDNGTVCYAGQANVSINGLA